MGIPMPDIAGLQADPRFKALPIERQQAILARIRKASGPKLSQAQDRGVVGSIRDWLADFASRRREREEVKATGVGMQPTAGELLRAGVTGFGAGALPAAAVAAPLTTAIGVGTSLAGAKIGGEGGRRIGEAIAPGVGELGEEAGMEIGGLIGGLPAGALAARAMRGRPRIRPRIKTKLPTKTPEVAISPAEATPETITEGAVQALVRKMAQDIGPATEQTLYEFAGRKLGQMIGVPGSVLYGGRVGRLLQRAVRDIRGKAPAAAPDTTLTGLGPTGTTTPIGRTAETQAQIPRVTVRAGEAEATELPSGITEEMIQAGLKQWKGLARDKVIALLESAEATRPAVAPAPAPASPEILAQTADLVAKNKAKMAPAPAPAPAAPPAAAPPAAPPATTPKPPLIKTRVRTKGAPILDMDLVAPAAPKPRAPKPTTPTPAKVVEPEILPEATFHGDLRAKGYRLENGQWYTPDGKRVTKAKYHELREDYRYEKDASDFRRGMGGPAKNVTTAPVAGKLPAGPATPAPAPAAAKPTEALLKQVRAIVYKSGPEAAEAAARQVFGDEIPAEITGAIQAAATKAKPKTETPDLEALLKASLKPPPKSAQMPQEPSLPEHMFSRSHGPLTQEHQQRVTDERVMNAVNAALDMIRGEAERVTGRPELRTIYAEKSPWKGASAYGAPREGEAAKIYYNPAMDPIRTIPHEMAHTTAEHKFPLVTRGAGEPLPGVIGPVRGERAYSRTGGGQVVEVSPDLAKHLIDNISRRAGYSPQEHAFQTAEDALRYNPKIVDVMSRLRDALELIMSERQHDVPLIRKSPQQIEIESLVP